ncbi:Hypothetical Protein FCC1311_068172 [Hondaea fermentalgiana]|uniref:Uncharacterized protein n=1 Tax=Hondaea fermentalgiana TaxID=2315210 RepID=A0A2R5GI83_9STRA|nr:Hypothetical Protein FCC1311_068172 [Hondaea fermentalgiana]|eukprot:GBG30597.1 Hypothetical Protein FCC1311_068172 [Hondaea fermentalgiana]
MGSFVDEYIVRNETVTIHLPLDYPSEHAREATAGMLAAQTVTSAIAMFFGIGAQTMLTYYLFKEKKNRSPAQQKVFLLLYAHIFFMTANSFVIFCFSVFKTPPSLWRVCNVAGTLPSTMYVAGNGLSYAIFLKRASATAFAAKRSKFATAMWYYALLGTYGIPGFICLMWLLINGRIIYGEICYQDHASWLAFMFTTIDTTLSLAFLYLFLEPVMQQLKIMHGGTGNSRSAATIKMRATAMKNLRWSSMTIFSTFLFMLIVSIVPNLETSEETRHLKMITWVGQPLDSFFTMIGMLAITSGIWRPKDLKGASSVTPATGVMSKASSVAATTNAGNE